MQQRSIYISREGDLVEKVPVPLPLLLLKSTCAHRGIIWSKFLTQIFKVVIMIKIKLLL